MTKRLIIFFVFIVSIFSVLAEAEKESVADASTHATPVTVVLDWTVNTNHTGLYVALDKGYYKDTGLDVSIVSPPETGGASLVVAGKAQFFVSYQEEITYARAAGTKLKALAAVIQHNTSGFAARKEEGINTPRDFEGKTYGGWGSPMEEAVIQALMKRYDADYSKVKNVSVGAVDFFAATEGDVDFMWIFYGWDGIAAGLKGVDISYIPIAEIEPSLDYYTPVLASSDQYISEEPHITKAFVMATAKGYQYAIEHPEEAAQILLKYAPELDHDLVLASQKYLAGQYAKDAERWGQMKLSVWHDFAAWLKENGLLEGSFSPEDAFTNEFLP
ncbi:ABC transporter substrate-binding protein [Spirochaetia bacterium 38H-sp]|uniref:ABC transporter substrate-binding protein n=1 Tax=Rarispira pelagica TaxID=3141764 RepID=A0ABU9UCB6_9SPIR